MSDSPERATHGRADILVVDDHPDKLIALQAVLSDLGQNVVKAGSGKDALRKLLERDFAVVLLDVNMPIMDGFERLPIIALTAKAMRGDREKCIEAGASDYVAKPVETERLLSTLRLWLTH